MTSLRSQLVKGNPKTKLYRDYNSLDVNLFKEELDKNLASNNAVNSSDFQNTFITVPRKHAPIKKKIRRFYDSLFMSKTLKKAIMHRSKLKNIKKRKEVNLVNYKNNGIFVSRCFRELRKTFQNLNVKDLLDNKTFCKTIKPYFSNKGLNSNKILLKENAELVSGKEKLVFIMSKFIINIAKSLNLKEEQCSPPVTLSDSLNFSPKYL